MAAKWTVMVYMAGFNNLSDFASKDLDEMRKVGSTDDVKIVVFIKQLNHASARYIVVGKDGHGEQTQDLGNVDSGNPQTLIDFIRWAETTAPAERYGLVVWNHGSGWRPDDLDQLYAEVRSQRGDTGVSPRELGIRSTQEVARTLFSTSVQEVLALPTSGERGIASDDGSGHSLDTVEFGRVLALANEALGGPLALLGMDACLMSAFEVAFQARANVKTVVGSEELEPGDGWPYTDILAELSANPAMTGDELGAVVVKHYVGSYVDREDQWPVTQAAVSTEHLEDFAALVDDLAQAMQKSFGDIAKAAQITRAQARSVSFTGDLIDVRTFCKALLTGSVDQQITDAAQRLLDALTPGSYVVAEDHRGPTVNDCGGVTLYFPAPLSTVSRYYADLDFAQRGWDEFLSGYQSAIRGN
jgi:hypothetical protein